MKARELPARSRWRAAATALAAAALLGASPADVSGATNWLTGAPLQRQLTQPVGISWSGNPLRQALGGLSRTQRVAVLIDRRVDPGQKLELQLNDLPLEALLREIARTRQLGVSLLGSVVYFGPPRASSLLRTIAALRTEEIRGLPADLQRKFLLPQRIAWDDFATPRDLLAQLAEQNGLQITRADLVPHDLWAAADLPPLSLVDRLTLILVQFDLTFQVARDGKSVNLVAVPERVALTRGYPGGPEPQATAERFALLVPEAQIKVVGEEVYVTGLLEAHEQITSALSEGHFHAPPMGGQPPKPAAAGPTDQSFANKRFTLRVKEQAAARVLQKLASELKLDLAIDQQALEAAGISLQSRVSLSVKDATLDELLHEVLKPVGLQFRRRGNVVEIFPPP
jgi:hypothetical protein